MHLTTCLERFYKTELGKLAATWATDTPSVRRALRRRADNLVKKLSQLRDGGSAPGRSEARRAMLLFRLLQLEGAELDPRHDALLELGLACLEPIELNEMEQPLRATIDALDGARAARLQRAILLRRVVHVSNEYPPRVWLLENYTSDFIFETIAVELELHLDPNYWSASAHASVDLLLLWLHYHPETRRSVPADYVIFVRQALKERMDAYWRWIPPDYEDAISDIMAEMPLEDRARLLQEINDQATAAGSIAWEYLHLAPTFEVLTQALAWVSQHQIDDNRHGALISLRRVGAPLLEPLHDALGASLMIEGLMAIFFDLANETSIDPLLSLLERDKRGLYRAPTQALLSTLNPEATLSTLTARFADADPDHQLALAETIALMALRLDVAEHVALARATEPPQRVLDVLEVADVNNSITLAELVGPFEAWYDSDAPLPFDEAPIWHKSARSLRSFVEQNAQLTWFQNILTRFETHRLNPLAAFIVWRYLPMISSNTRDAAWEAFARSFSHQVLLDVAQVTLERRPPRGSDRYMYKVLARHRPAATALHLRVLERGSLVFQEVAIEVLAESFEACLTPVSQMLERGKLSARSAAARFFERAGDPRAIKPLEDAIAKERSSKVKVLLEGALTVCDPSRSRDVVDMGYGIYARRDPFDFNAAMGELRGVFYEEPSAARWVRLVDLLTRFDHEGALPLAMDYVGSHDLAAWPAELKTRPDPWVGHPLLEPLLPPPPPPPTGYIYPAPRWLAPISTLHREDRDAILSEALSTIERGAQTRRLRLPDVDSFLDVVERGWRFCAEHRVSPDHLRVRLDGGGVKRGYIGSSGSTGLELTEGFGVILQRGGPHQTDGDPGPGLRYVRLRVPARHPLRNIHGLGRRHYLDLEPLLSDDAP